MTPPNAASANPASTTRPTVADTLTAYRAALLVAPTDDPDATPGMTDTEWANRYAAIDLLAVRLHSYDCTGADCSDTHWMAWTGPAVAALTGAHVYTHHHSTGRRVIIEIDLPPKPSHGHGAGGTSGVGGAPGRWCA